MLDRFWVVNGKGNSNCKNNSNGNGKSKIRGSFASLRMTKFWGKGKRMGNCNYNGKNRRERGVRSPPVARSGGLRMGHPSFRGWLGRTGNCKSRSSAYGEG